jgi:hypothetical protein
MYLRSLCIAILHWLTSFFAIAVMLGFIFPQNASGWALNVPAWILAFLLSALFASWTFSPYLPGRREIFCVMIVWFLVLVTGYLGYGILFSLRGPFLIFEWEFLIQIALQLSAVWLAGFRLRRRKLKEVLGEGMVM